MMWENIYIFGDIWLHVKYFIQCSYHMDGKPLIPRIKAEACRSTGQLSKPCCDRSVCVHLNSYFLYQIEMILHVNLDLHICQKCLHLPFLYNIYSKQAKTECLYVTSAYYSWTIWHNVVTKNVQSLASKACRREDFKKQGKKKKKNYNVQQVGVIHS